MRRQTSNLTSAQAALADELNVGMFASGHFLAREHAAQMFQLLILALAATTCTMPLLASGVYAQLCLLLGLLAFLCCSAAIPAVSGFLRRAHVIRLGVCALSDAQAELARRELCAAKPHAENGVCFGETYLACLRTGALLRYDEITRLEYRQSKPVFQHSTRYYSLCAVRASGGIVYLAQRVLPHRSLPSDELCLLAKKVALRAGVPKPPPAQHF